MSSRAMTLLGYLNAGIIFALLSPPEGIPKWLLWIIGIVGAIVSAASGTTHPGKPK